jgi:hypothetical protein
MLMRGGGGGRGGPLGGDKAGRASCPTAGKEKYSNITTACEGGLDGTK